MSAKVESKNNVFPVLLNTSMRWLLSDIIKQTDRSRNWQFLKSFGCGNWSSAFWHFVDFLRIYLAAEI